jgi:hypothetical protein
MPRCPHIHPFGGSSRHSTPRLPPSPERLPPVGLQSGEADAHPAAMAGFRCPAVRTRSETRPWSVADGPLYAVTASRPTGPAGPLGEWLGGSTSTQPPGTVADPALWWPDEVRATGVCRPPAPRHLSPKARTIVRLMPPPLRCLAVARTASYGVSIRSVSTSSDTATRPPRRRTPPPGHHRTRREELRRHRLQRILRRLGQDLHRSQAVRGRRPAHLRRQPDRNQHRVVPTARPAQPTAVKARESRSGVGTGAAIQLCRASPGGRVQLAWQVRRSVNRLAWLVQHMPATQTRLRSGVGVGCPTAVAGQLPPAVWCLLRFGSCLRRRRSSRRRRSCSVPRRGRPRLRRPLQVDPCGLWLRSRRHSP